MALGRKRSKLRNQWANISNCLPYICSPNCNDLYISQSVLSRPLMWVRSRHSLVNSPTGHANKKIHLALAKIIKLRLRVIRFVIVSLNQLQNCRKSYSSGWSTSVTSLGKLTTHKDPLVDISHPWPCWASPHLESGINFWWGPMGHVSNAFADRTQYSQSSIVALMMTLCAPTRMLTLFKSVAVASRAVCVIASGSGVRTDGRTVALLEPAK